MSTVRDHVEELTWRGLLHDSMPGTRDYLNQGPASGYIGFDPTADSLHVGNMVQIMMLKHFQESGHRPIALVGGATGMVGDPSGKSSERNLLSEEELRHNQHRVGQQLERFLDFKSKVRPAELVNNYDWFKDMGFLTFIRDVGKHIPVGYMLAKDSVKNRMETGISFTEFTYQLVQGYDFYWLYKHKGCKLQMGGSDQWGNITTGTELIRRMDGGEAYALTTPLLTKADGSKFGKSEGGNIWLDSARTSPYKFYQFWRNVTDVDAVKLIRIFHPFTRDVVELHIANHSQNPEQGGLQKELARVVTDMVHGSEAARTAYSVSRLLFDKSLSTKDSLSEFTDAAFFALYDEIPSATVSKQAILSGMGLLQLLTEETDMLPSKAEAKRALQEGSIYLNRERMVGDCDLGEYNLISGMFILLQRGKKNYFLVKAV